MKYLMTLIFASLVIFGSAQKCDNAQVYANKKQTEIDKRFDDYEKIKGVPKIKGGKKKLNQIITDNLVVSDIAKSQIFNLNFQFTIDCEGKIVDVKQIGDVKADDWTNITEVILLTEGLWKPAKEGGETVNCVYFHRFFVMGSRF